MPPAGGLQQPRSQARRDLFHRAVYQVGAARGDQHRGCLEQTRSAGLGLATMRTPGFFFVELFPATAASHRPAETSSPTWSRTTWMNPSAAFDNALSLR